MVITEKTLINCDFRKVYNTFRDPNKWLEILPFVVGVEVIYNDNRHQEFIMTVSKPTGNESARAIRYCLKDKILVYQPDPPPGFNSVYAEWRFKSINGKTEVEAVREISHKHFPNEVTKTYDDNREYNEIKEKLHSILKSNLDIFKTSLEA